MRIVLGLLATASSVLGSPARPASPEIALDEAEAVVVGIVVARPDRPGDAYPFRVTESVKGGLEPGVHRVGSFVREIPGVPQTAPKEQKGQRLVLFLGPGGHLPQTLSLTSLTALDEFETGSGDAWVERLRRLADLHAADRNQAVRAWRSALQGDETMRLLALERVSLTGSYGEVGHELAARIREAREREPLRLAKAVLAIPARDASSIASAKLRALGVLAHALDGAVDDRDRAARFAIGLAGHRDVAVRVEAMHLLGALGRGEFAESVRRLVAGDNLPAAQTALEAARREALRLRPLRERLAARPCLEAFAGALDRPPLRKAAVDALEAILNGSSATVAEEALPAAAERWRQRLR